MDQPKWQKARFVSGDFPEHRRQSELIGKTFWVAVPPRWSYLRNEVTLQMQNYRVYDCNIRSHLYNRDVVPVELVELLPEFADDIPIISWEEFLAGGNQCQLTEQKQM